MGTADVLAGVKGAVVVPEDVEAFSDGVASVLRDPAKRMQFAREDAQRWTSRSMAERLARLYENVIEADVSRSVVTS
jgi:glycosyltransferase involved in cell wall biosynthesis